MPHDKHDHMGKFYQDGFRATMPGKEERPHESCVGCGRLTRNRHPVFETPVPACSAQCAQAFERHETEKLLRALEPLLVGQTKPH